MHRSADGGATWEETAGIVYPPKPDDVPEIRDNFRNVVVPWSLEKVWSLETGGADQPGLLWCGTIPGGLFRSTDSGVTWELVRSLWDRPERADWGGGGYDFPGIHSICVDPRNSQRVAVAISCADRIVKSSAASGARPWRRRRSSVTAAETSEKDAPSFSAMVTLAKLVRPSTRFWSVV